MIHDCLNISDFSANLFTLDQEKKPTDAVQFLEGLNVLASRALDALSKPEDVELAFHRIKNANLVELSSEDKKNVDQRIQDVFKNWVKVRFGSHSRHIPRKRLAEQCGPKFRAQYTSQMKEATDRELDLKSTDSDECPTDDCPEECKKLLLVYLQTGALPPETLGDNALNMLVLAEQHQLEGLIRECLDFLIDNLSIENLDTFLEFTEKTYCPRLGLACLNFMQDNRDSISEDLETKYQEELSIVEVLKGGKITLNLSSSGKIEAEVKTFTDQTADVLQKINNRFRIVSLILPKADPNTLSSFLEQIAPNLKPLQELRIWNKTPTESDLPKLKGLFPNLEALGNDAPFLKTIDEVKTYLENFREPGVEGPESKKPLLRSLNLKNVPNLTDAQLAELTTYSQELYRLFIKSDKITSVIAPKATRVDCSGCTLLSTLEVPKATKVKCYGCTVLTTLEAPEATGVYCSGCTALTTFEVPEAAGVYCSGCTALTTLNAPKATLVDCSGCTALTTLNAPKATGVDCSGCTALTTLEAPEATEIHCRGCTKLTTLKAPAATEIHCNDCTALTTLEAPEAIGVYCSGCTALTTLKAPKATWVNCYGCTALTTLEAPVTTGFDCSGCTALTTLNAPQATTVYCNDCTALTTLTAPLATDLRIGGCTAITSLEALETTEINLLDFTALKTLKVPTATWVDCNDCATLTTLHAPQAITVYCNDCTNLTTLKAPKANVVHSNGCAALTTLEVPEATSIYCHNCTKLTTLIAPVAVTVTCIGCTGLTTLKLPKAIWIYCNDCTKLTTFEAPSATRLDCRGCTNLTTLHAPQATTVLREG